MAAAGSAQSPVRLRLCKVGLLADDVGIGALATADGGAAAIVREPGRSAVADEEAMRSELGSMNGPLPGSSVVEESEATAVDEAESSSSSPPDMESGSGMREAANAIRRSFRLLAASVSGPS